MYWNTVFKNKYLSDAYTVSTLVKSLFRKYFFSLKEISFQNRTWLKRLIIDKKVKDF